MKVRQKIRIERLHLEQDVENQFMIKSPRKFYRF